MSDLCNTLENHHLMPLGVAVNTACLEQLLEEKITESSARLEQLLEDKLKEMLESMNPGGGRIRCTEHLHLYVSPTGDDTNTGLSQEQAFATANRAVQRLNDFDVAGYEATINLAAGNYAEDVLIGAAATGCGAAQLTLLGESGVEVSTITVDSCAIPVLVKDMLIKPVAGTLNALWVVNHSKVTVEGVHIQALAAIAYGMVAQFQGHLIINTAEFSGTYNYAALFAHTCSSLRFTGGLVKYNAVRCVAVNILISRSSVGFLEAPKFSGSVTGSKYRVSGASNMGSQYVSSIPGSTAGTLDTGGTLS